MQQFDQACFPMYATVFNQVCFPMDATLFNQICFPKDATLFDQARVLMEATLFNHICFPLNIFCALEINQWFDFLWMQHCSIRFASLQTF